MAIKKPKDKPNSLSVSRSGDSFSVSWKIPSTAKSQTKKSGGAWTKQRVVCKMYNTANKQVGGTLTYTIKNRTTKKQTMSLSNGNMSWARFWVQGGNSKGWGGQVSIDYYYSQADYPSVSTPTITTSGTSAGDIAFYASSSDCNTGRNRRTLLQTKITRYSNLDGDTPVKVVEDWGRNQGGGGAVSISFSRNEAKWQSFSRISDMITYKIEARNIGHNPRGAVNTTSNSAQIRLSYPDSFETLEPVESDETITLPIQRAWARDLNTFQMEYSISESEINPADWSDVDGAEGNGSVQALTVAKNFFSVSTGEYVWLRVRGEYLTKQTALYSTPVLMRSISKPPADEASAGDIAILSVSPSETESDALFVTAGFNGELYDRTEFSWAASSDISAWKSTKTPDSYQCDWADEDGATDEHTGIEYSGTTKLKIVGLSENTTYLCRARRFNKADDSEHGGWSAQTPYCFGTTGGTPAGLSVSVPAQLAEGEPLSISWVLGGYDVQTGYAVSINGEDYVVADGEANSLTIPAEAFDGLSEATVLVRVSNGGTNWITPTDSDGNEKPSTVAILPKPVLTLTTTQTITTKPHAFTATVSNVQGASVDVRLVAMGVTSQQPFSSERQYPGDVVWKQTFATLGELAIPAEAELVDGAQYYLEATPHANGVTGETVTATFDDKSNLMTVAWAHQAVAVDAAAEVLAVDAENRTVTITPIKPEGADDTDVCDIWRTADSGEELIAAGVAWGTSWLDSMAPFSINESTEADDMDLSYRLVTRTVNGDLDWQDFPYVLTCDKLRFDWDNDFIELPWWSSFNDSYSKNYEGVTFLDGTRKGYWREGATLTSNIASSTIKVFEPADVAKLHDLAAHAGAVFVRSPLKHAYEANVEVSIDQTAVSPIASVSYKTERVDNGDFPATRVIEEAASDE